jgi:hypothetical protein
MPLEQLVQLTDPELKANMPTMQEAQLDVPELASNFPDSQLVHVLAFDPE